MKLRVSISIMILISGLIGSYLYIKADSKSMKISAQLLQHFYNDLFVTDINPNLLLGSSTIRNINSTGAIHCGSWLNRGIGHATIEDLITYIKYSPLKLKPKMILLYLGENDVASSTNQTQIISQTIKLITLLELKFGDSDIHFIAIKPSPVRQHYYSQFSLLNVKLKRLSQSQSNLYFHTTDWPINSQALLKKYFLSDNIHLTHEGYKHLFQGFNKTCK